MYYYSTSSRDRRAFGPRDVAGEIGFAQGHGDAPRVGSARGHSLIPRDYHADRPAEVLWKLHLGGDELPGLWTLRMGRFARHQPVPDDVGTPSLSARLARQAPGRAEPAADRSVESQIGASAPREE
jgi:hypothetical protein